MVLWARQGYRREVHRGRTSLVDIVSEIIVSTRMMFWVHRKYSEMKCDDEMTWLYKESNKALLTNSR